MKQIVRYRFLTVPNKLFVDVRIGVDDTIHAETRSQFEGGTSTNLVLLPMINIQLMKPLEMDSTGRKFRPASSLADSIGLTKFTFPTFITELKSMHEDMKTADLYVYHGNRLDLNDKVAEKIRRAFIIGRTGIEFRAVVIEQPTEAGDVERLEGIKMKINNESTTVLLTLREIESMLWVFNHVDIDNIVLTMYTSFIERSVYERRKPVVDIIPVSKPVYTTAEVYTSVSEPTVEKPATPVKQETVLELPTDKYRIGINDDFSQYMNPPVTA